MHSVNANTMSQISHEFNIRDTAEYNIHKIKKLIENIQLKVPREKE